MRQVKKNTNIFKFNSYFYFKQKETVETQSVQAYIEVVKTAKLYE